MTDWSFQNLTKYLVNNCLLTEYFPNKRKSTDLIRCRRRWKTQTKTKQTKFSIQPFQYLIFSLMVLFPILRCTFSNRLNPLFNIVHTACCMDHTLSGLIMPIVIILSGGMYIILSGGYVQWSCETFAIIFTLYENHLYSDKHQSVFSCRCDVPIQYYR